MCLITNKDKKKFVEGRKKMQEMSFFRYSVFLRRGVMAYDFATKHNVHSTHTVSNTINSDNECVNI